MDSGTKEIMMVQGGGKGASVCGAVRWGPVTAQDT